MSDPRFITRKELDERIRQEILGLAGEDRAWWSAHEVEPFVVTSGDICHYAVAVSSARALIFFDDEDEFGMAVLGDLFAIEGMCLYGDLVDAVRGLARLDSREAATDQL
jgi:hypothetical protein